MLGRDRLRQWVDHFGTPESQIRRDHLISHLLVQLPELASGATFFGGTALCRTHLPGWRLSEDVDLLVHSTARAMEAFDDGLAPALRREFPGLTLGWGRDGDTVVGKVAADDLAVRVQLVNIDSSYRRYSSARMHVELRYEDLPSTVELRCPTRDAASAMKLNAWAGRATPRDLCDLYGLVRADAMTLEALAIAAEASRPVQPHHFGKDRLPTEEAWQAALGHQMREPPPRHVALESVRSSISSLAKWVDKRGSG